MKDKIAHALLGWIISLALGGLFQNVVIGFVFRNSLVGFFTGCLAGAAKEVVWDWWLKKGTPEFLDFLATCAGALFGFVFLLFAGF